MVTDGLGKNKKGKELVLLLGKLESIKCGVWLLKSVPINVIKKMPLTCGAASKMCGYFGYKPLHQHLSLSSKSGQEASAYIAQNIRA